MANRVRLRPEAEEDIRDACDWYDAFVSKIEAIGQNPSLNSFVLKTYRRTILSRFPYAIVYELEDDGAIVYAVNLPRVIPDRGKIASPDRGLTRNDRE